MKTPPATTAQKTIKDYQHLEEGAPIELINGRLVEEPSPSYDHQETSRRIVEQILFHLKKTQQGKVLYAPLDVFFEGDHQNALQPDILFIANENKHLIKEDGIHGAPDLIIEILSPSTGYYDLKEKKNIYEKNGVKEYWVVDPADGEVIGHSLKNNTFKESYRGKGTFHSPLLDLDINLEEPEI